MQIKLPDLGKSNNDPVSRMVEEKHQEYLVKAKRYALAYYVTRLSAGLSAGLLPFTLQYVGPTGSLLQRLPMALSIVIVVATVFDLVFGPKEKWILYSKATDLLAIAVLKAMGQYERYAESLDLILTTESAALQNIMNLNELVAKIEAAREEPAR